MLKNPVYYNIHDIVVIKINGPPYFADVVDSLPEACWSEPLDEGDVDSSAKKVAQRSQHYTGTTCDSSGNTSATRCGKNYATRGFCEEIKVRTCNA